MSYRLNLRLVLAAYILLFITLAPFKAAAQSFSFSGFTFDERVYLSEAELQDAASTYRNRAITFADVKILVAQL